MSNKDSIYNINEAPNYYNSIKDEYLRRRKIDLNIQPKYRIYLRWALLITIFPVWQLSVFYLNKYIVFSPDLFYTDLKFILLVTIFVAFLLLALDFIIDNSKSQKAQTLISDEVYLFGLSYHSFVNTKSLEVSFDKDKANIIRQNSKLIKKILSINLLQDLRLLESRNAIVSYEYILKYLETIPWINFEPSSMLAAKSMNRISTVTFGLLSDQLFDNRIIPIYQNLYSYTYSKLWHESRLSDVSDTYKCLDDLNKFVNSVDEVKTKNIYSSKDGLKERINNLVIGLFKNEYLVVRFLTWLVTLVFITYIMTGFLLNQFAIEVDSKIIALIVSAPLGGAVLFSINYK